MKGEEFYFNTEKLDKRCGIMLFRGKQGEDYRAFCLEKRGKGLGWFGNVREEAGCLLTGTKTNAKTMYNGCVSWIFLGDSNKGDIEMEYRIENLDFELRIIGKNKAVKTNRAFKTISTLWNTAKKTGLCKN